MLKYRMLVKEPRTSFVRWFVREEERRKEDESAAKEGRRDYLVSRGVFQAALLPLRARMHANAELTLVPRRSERREDEARLLPIPTDSRRREGEREKTTRRREGGGEEAMRGGQSSFERNFCFEKTGGRGKLPKGDN